MHACTPMPRPMQELEEELVVTRQDLEDAQTNNAAIEEDLSETQVIIRGGVYVHGRCCINFTHNSF